MSKENNSGEKCKKCGKEICPKCGGGCDCRPCKCK